MPLGDPAQFRHYTREISPRTLGVVLAIFIFFDVGLQSYGDREYGTWLQYEHFIAALVQIDAASKERPEWERKVGLTASDLLWSDLDLFCRSAERKGFFPEESYASWALAALWFGEPESAKTIAGKIHPSSPENRLVLALLEGTAPGHDDLSHLYEAFTREEAGWLEAYLLGELSENNEHLITWIGESGQKQQRRTLIHTLATWAFLGIGIVCGIWLIVRRRNLWPSPPQEFRLPAAWKLTTVLTVLFAGLLAGSLINFALVSLPIPDSPQWFAVSVISYLLFLGVPTMALAVSLTPSVRATCRLLGLLEFRAKWGTVIATVLAATTILWLVGYLVSIVERSLTMADLRDSLSIDLLYPYSFAAGLVSACLIAPVCEEVIFRGFLLRAFGNCLSPLTAAIASSAIFATYHWYSLFGWIVIFAMGLVFCWLARWSRSLWPAILAHASINLIYTWQMWATFSFF